METSIEITDAIEEIIILDHPPEPVVKTSMSVVNALASQSSQRSPWSSAASQPAPARTLS